MLALASHQHITVIVCVKSLAHASKSFRPLCFVSYFKTVFLKDFRRSSLHSWQFPYCDHAERETYLSNTDTQVMYNLVAD